MTQAAPRGLAAHKGPPDRKGLLEPAVKRETPARKARRVSRAHQESRAPLDPALRDPRAMQETKDRRGHRARKDLWAPRGHKDRQDCAARQAPRESRALTAPRACRASREFLHFKS